MTERKLTDEEIEAMFERFAGLVRDVTKVMEQMAENMDHVIGILRHLASLQGVDVTLPDRDKEATP